MTCISAALPFYPKRYQVKADKSQLERRREFHTHSSPHAERLHRISETLFLPARIEMQLLARVFEPLPGAKKEKKLLGVAIRIASVALAILLIPFALISSAISFPLRFITHTFRPSISFIDNSSSAEAKGKKSEELLLTKESPLSIRTHNVGFVTSAMSIAGDLRPPEERAREIVKSIVEDPHKPDIIFFQETFQKNATKILAEGIKEEYPYITHTIAPHLSGFSSGSMVASKYPIEEVYFQKFGHMSGPEKLSPRGITRIRLQSSKGPILLYGVHTQALIGESRAKARLKQIGEMKEMMARDREKVPAIPQILMGDFNTSRLTAWGEDNLEPKGQAEEEVMEELLNSFEDPYLLDHDSKTGERTGGTPFYLQKDNERMGEILTEPSGSWFQGPLDPPGKILSSKMRRDRRKHGRPDPKKVIFLEASTWGTKSWRKQQTAKSARFDYILFPKGSKLKGYVEIRRGIVPKDSESASTDHLRVDGRIWLAS